MEFGRLLHMLQKGCFALILLVFSGVCSWPSVSMQTPYGKHQWRQCDAYSMALNYYEEEAGFFDPRMHFQHGNGLGSGRSVGEFPVTYWFNAKLWNGIGLKPHTMRWTHMLLWILGCLAIFKLGREWFGSGKSAFATTFVMASPLIAFYSASYLVNVAGLAMVFVAWRLAWKIFGHERFRWGTELMLFIVLSCSVLFRPTMVLGWVPIAIWAFHRGQWKHWVLRLSAPLGMGLLWVLWAKSVNAAAGSVYYLTSIRPLWATQNSEEVWRAFREDVLPEWYHKYVLGILVAIVLVLAFKHLFSADSFKEKNERKTKELHLPAMIRLMALGLVLYFFLWFENLDVHDYYLIEFQLIVPLVLWWCIQRLEQLRVRNGRLNRVIWSVLIVALSFQLLEAHLRTRMKYMPPKGWLSEVILTQRDRDLWSWFHWDQEMRLTNLQQLKSAMREYGIKRDDRIISVPDPSPNITLSLLDQKGFTDLYDETMTGDERIAFYVEKGASFLVCSSAEWLQERAKSPWLQQPIIDLDGLVVFDLLNSEPPLPDHGRQ